MAQFLVIICFFFLLLLSKGFITFDEEFFIILSFFIVFLFINKFAGIYIYNELEIRKKNLLEQFEKFFELKKLVLQDIYNFYKKRSNILMIKYLKLINIFVTYFFFIYFFNINYMIYNLVRKIYIGLCSIMFFENNFLKLDFYIKFNLNDVELFNFCIYYLNNVFFTEKYTTETILQNYI